MKRGAYYNEFDGAKAVWLRELIARNLIAPGDVDERSIADVQGSDLAGYAQCHFFAGIGVWSHALRLAAWPDDREAWTGSCPCQPFSSAGKGLGVDDPRHLWPQFSRLIRECAPPVIFGEQVGGKAGRAWLDLVYDDLEADDYAVGAGEFPACSVGAPHIRQRLYWVAFAESEQLDGRGDTRRGRGEFADDGDARDGLGDAHSPRKHAPILGAESGRLVQDRIEAGGPGPVNGFWHGADWLPCRDEKWRPVESGTFPLAHGAPERMGRLRGYGDAIVASQAATWIEVCSEAMSASAAGIPIRLASRVSDEIG